MALGAAVLLNAGANVLIKRGVRALAGGGDGPLGFVLALATSPTVLVGIACFGAAFVGYAYALRAVDLSIAYAVMIGLGYVLVVLASVLLLGESLSTLQALGIALILVGLLLLNPA